MTVTQIEAYDKSRSKIYLDGEFAFVLYRGELKEYHIREGGELSQESCDRILRETLGKRAKLRAMHLLQKREYTVAQLRDKLAQGLYPQQVIEDALAYVASFHYTDDLRYAVQYMTLHAEDRSRRRIEQDLGARGISGETLECAWRTWEEQGGGQDEEQMIRKLLAKRKFDPDTADYAECGKQAAFLMRKGFSADCIRRVLREKV